MYVRSIMKVTQALHLQLILVAMGWCLDPYAIQQSDRAISNSNSNAEASTNKLEDTVVHDMLKIVDHKFDTLTTRITALERAVSGLQFYSIRQFQRLGGSLQKTQDATVSIGKKVSQLEIDGRGLKIAMSLLNRDISEVKSTTTDVLAELESSVIYINDNVDKQAQVLKNALADEANKIVMATDELLVRQTEEDLSRQRDKQVQNEKKIVNCSVDFSHLHERFDVRLEDFKQELVSNYLNPMVDMQLQFQEFSSALVENSTKDFDSRLINRIMKDSQSKTNEGDTMTSTSATDVSDQSAVSDEQVSKNSIESDSAEDIQYVENRNRYEVNDERIMNLLINMTNSVLQSQSYFRQSGGLMEEILANTYDLTRGQEFLKSKILSLSGTDATSDQSEEESVGDNDVRSHPEMRAYPGIRFLKKPVPIARKYNLYRRFPQPEKPESSSGASQTNNCGIPKTVVDGLATVFRNGSQLLEILTDLAQMSSTSLAKATGSLQDEINRMEDVRKRMASTLTVHHKGNTTPASNLTTSVQRFDNATQRLQQLIESNTGWLRLIYRSNLHVEKLSNRSLLMTNRNYQLLLKNHKHKLMLFDLAAKAKSNANDKNEVIRHERRDENGEDDVILSVSGLKEDIVLDKESLEMIYSTSLQLNRIMPALTKLLAEPDPLITLVDGNDDAKGRLEVYNNGQWGTICHEDLTNDEADAVCRHLGFQGGFSAGAGRFGAGSGVAWTLNITCLESVTFCTPVKLLKDMSLCDHEKDVGVICDHMLRIVASTNDSLASPKSGRLEIMHQGLWLPVCGEGWSGFSSRVACKQMGFLDGRELVQDPWSSGTNSTWLNKVACSGQEPYLDACQFKGWSDSCPDLIPAGVRCL